MKVHTVMEGLCGKCREGEVITQHNGAVHYVCALSHPMFVFHSPVTQCTAFDDKRIQSKYDMEKIAWRLRTDASGQKIGFAPPTKKEREED